MEKCRGGSNLYFSNPNRVESSENFLEPNRTLKFQTQTEPNLRYTIRKKASEIFDDNHDTLFSINFVTFHSLIEKK